MVDYEQEGYKNDRKEKNREKEIENFIVGSLENNDYI